MIQSLRYADLLAVVVVLFGLTGTAHAQELPTIVGVRTGFAGEYKLGCWTPLEVELTGGSKPLVGFVTVTVPDGDGVPTTVMTPATRPVSVEARERQSVRLFIRVGQSYCSLQVKLFDTEGDEVASRTFHAAGTSAEGSFTTGRPATNRLIVEFGRPVGLGDLIQSDNQDELLQTRIARVDEAADFPSEWFGYEGVDAVVLTTSRADLYRPLAQNRARVAALRRWVEMGGKLVIFCGSQADALLVKDGALAELLPGTYVESVQINQSQSIEAFSGAEQSITPDRRVDLRVPVFTDIRGKVLASAKRGDSEIPLVIQSNLGFGELTFVGLDFDRPPLADWAGRRSFLGKAVGLTTQSGGQQQNAGVVEVTSDDLIVQVQNALGETVGVEPVPFALVAVLVVAYILVIGPGDYYLVNKVFKRPEITWISFPLTVVAVSAGAYWFANWQKGDELRVNQVEFVDVDSTSGLTRGTVWTYFFTPQVAKFDLSLQPAFFSEQLASSERLAMWLGQPGYALGGMQTGGGQTGLFDSGYRFDTGLDAMIGVPVQLWSTKTITSRWSSSEVRSPVDAKLNRTDDQLVLGQIVNNSDESLEDCILLYGQWAWNLGTLAGGLSLDMTAAPQPRTVRTLLTNATAGDTTITETADDGTVPFRLASSDMTRLAKVMMFFEAINGTRYTGMLSRYQAFLDMSHLLEQPDLAVLLTRSKSRSSKWFDGDKPLGNDKDANWTYYRFVVPVGPLVEE